MLYFKLYRSIVSIEHSQTINVHCGMRDGLAFLPVTASTAGYHTQFPPEVLNVKAATLAHARQTRHQVRGMKQHTRHN